MKLKIKILFIAFCFLAFTKVNAQIDPSINMDLKKLPQMLERNLIVVLLDEDAKEVAKLEKHLDKEPNGLKNYREEIKTFNDAIKSGMEKYWKLNSKIDYKNQSEIKDFMKGEEKAKSHDNMVLMLAYLKDHDSDVMTRSDFNIPSLYYTRAEESSRNPDYKVYIPNARVRKKIAYTETDIHVAIIELVDNIKYMQDNNKIFKYTDFVKAMAKENCGQMDGKTILIDKELLDYKPGEGNAKIKDKYKGDFKIVDHNEITAAFNEKRANTVIIMCVPYGIAKGSMGPLTSAMLISGKITVDCATHQVLNENELAGGVFAMTGKIMTLQILARNVQGVSECAK